MLSDKMISVTVTEKILLKIAFIGAPGSGKTTLSTQVFTALKQSGKNVEIVQEWVRQDIFSSGAMSSIWEQYRTRQHQKELEDAVPSVVEYTVVDSSTLTPYFYASLYVNLSNSRERLVLQDMYKYLLDDLFLRRYEYIFYVPVMPEINTDDGTRFQSTTEISTLAEHMELVFLKLFKTDNIHLVDGSFEDRLQKVLSIIQKV